jgi:predicted ATPase
VSNAKLISLSLERFKSYRDATTIEFAPLTVILGRNNSGKSSIIQALLLLKQTLSLPRPDVPLHLEGFVDALNLRELTHGWPAKGPDVAGPKISVRWVSEVSIAEALATARNPDLTTLIANTKLHWLTDNSAASVQLTTELTLDYAERDGRTALRQLTLSSGTHLTSLLKLPLAARFTFKLQPDGTYRASFNGSAAPQLTVELDHFLPYLLLNRSTVGPRDRQRSWYNAFLLLFAQPLEDLKALLSNLAYLGSIRVMPATLYRPATVPPEDIGVSGEYAAQMLHARQGDRVHYLPPVTVQGSTITLPDMVRSRSLVEAVNDVFASLSVDTPLRLDDIKDVGFRLLFGQASLQHVGRGLSYLLPVIQLGLIADPLRFEPKLQDVTLEEYEKACPHYTHCALEEPEAHLHPKVQTRLAHWLVSLAMARRQIIVETHSDHMVRRLRGLVARAQPGSAAERWLLGNVRVLQIEQEDGVSVVKSATLTALGGLETWPAEFMDEATEEERSIYDASLDKPETSPGPMPPIAEVVEDVGEEPDLPQ